MFSTLLVVALAMPAATLKADIVIDDFSAGGFFQQASPGTNTQTVMDGSILGGTRSDTLTVPSQPGALFGLINYSGILALSQGSADEITGSLSYPSLSGLDLTGGGSNDAFGFAFISSDSPIPVGDVLSLNVTDDDSSANVTFAVPASADLPAETLLLFSEFAGIDFTNVQSVELSFDFTGHAGRDFTLDFFGATNAIPEPTTAGLAVLAALGLVVRRRR